MSQDQDLKEEVDVSLEVSSDSKQIKLTFNSPDAFTISSFIMELETYLHEISTAGEQMERPGVNRH